MTATEITTSIKDRTATLKRVFDAPAALLFEVHSTPEHMKQWWGPQQWPLTTCEMEFRTGGAFRFAMTGPGGEKGAPFGGRYLEVTPNTKIVYDNGFLDDPKQETMVVTLTFDERADGTTVLTSHTVFASVSMAEEHIGQGFADGTASSLDNLAKYLADRRR